MQVGIYKKRIYVPILSVIWFSFNSDKFLLRYEGVKKTKFNRKSNGVSYEWASGGFVMSEKNVTKLIIYNVLRVHLHWNVYTHLNWNTFHIKLTLTIQKVQNIEFFSKAYPTLSSHPSKVKRTKLKWLEWKVVESGGIGSA